MIELDEAAAPYRSRCCELAIAAGMSWKRGCGLKGREDALCGLMTAHSPRCPIRVRPGSDTRARRTASGARAYPEVLAAFVEIHAFTACVIILVKLQFGQLPLRFSETSPSLTPRFKLPRQG